MEIALARVPEDREDLLRDATAYPTRIQLTVEWNDLKSEVFAGFRRGGAASFYFDQDPVYHFNDRGELRRAFVEGRLVKAEKRRLIALVREHRNSEVAMVREELTDEMKREFLNAAKLRFVWLSDAIRRKAYRIEGEVRGEGDQPVLKSAACFVSRLDNMQVADSARVG